MNKNESISLFIIAPKGLTKNEFLAWFDNLGKKDFNPLILE